MIFLAHKTSLPHLVHVVQRRPAIRIKLTRLGSRLRIAYPLRLVDLSSEVELLMLEADGVAIDMVA